jgi:hypothetical protein
MAFQKLIKREQLIFLQETDESTFSIQDSDGKEIVGSDAEYFIYFKNVNFLPNGRLRGRYLGENPDKIIDEHCKPVRYTDDGWKYEHGRKIIKTARMVAVQNKTSVVIVIENS